MNKNRIIFEFVFAFSILCSAYGDTRSVNAPNETAGGSGLQIYLPREIAIQDSALLLGHIGIVRGTETLVKKANQVTLGRFSMPSQEIVISRNTILSRLASNGVPASDVTFMGAEEVAVKQKQHIITGDDFIKLADDFLKNNLAGNSITGWKPVRASEELIIPDSEKDIKYSYALDKNIQGSRISVGIAVLSGDKNIGSRNVIFRLEYENRVPVAVTDIAAGTVITSENVKIEKRSSSLPEPADWKSPYGLLARRAIQANTVVTDNMVGSAEPPVIIKRNQSVVIRVEKPGFSITAVGKTMQDGKAGDVIKIKNADSQRIIIAKVNEDGSVEPM
ncbi:MAG: flagellar basal body P-ring formation protein FlgA [Sedimentisphaerales bacterium]|nr:flagellar basal body P-ring formation protein FlgA [Sedimentisphaerales bacterium]